MRLNEKTTENMTDELFAVIIGGICILILIVWLFVFQWETLEEGRIECEDKGGVWKSMSSGKVVTTSCKLP